MNQIINSFSFKNTISQSLLTTLKTLHKFIALNLIIFISSVPFLALPALIYISFQNLLASLISAGVSLIFVLILATYFKLSLLKFSINQIKQESTKITEAFEISFQQFYRSCIAYLRIYLPAFIALLILAAITSSYFIMNAGTGSTASLVSQINDQAVFLNQITLEAPSAILTQQDPASLFSLNSLNNGINSTSAILGLITIPIAIIFTLLNLLKYIFATYLILDQDLTVRDAFSKAKTTMYGNKLKLIGFFILNTFIFTLPLTILGSFTQNQNTISVIIILVIIFLLSIFLKNYFNLCRASIYQQLFLTTPTQEFQKAIIPNPVIEQTEPIAQALPSQLQPEIIITQTPEVQEIAIEQPTTSSPQNASELSNDSISNITLNNITQPKIVSHEILNTNLDLLNFYQPINTGVNIPTDPIAPMVASDPIIIASPVNSSETAQEIEPVTIQDLASKPITITPDPMPMPIIPEIENQVPPAIPVAPMPIIPAPAIDTQPISPPLEGTNQNPTTFQL